MILSISFWALLLIGYVLALENLKDTQHQIQLESFFNNRGGSGPGSNLDGANNYFDCPALKSSNLTIGNIDFHLSTSKENDNVVSQAQIIPLDTLSLGAIYLLSAVNHGPLTSDIIVVYQDGTYSTTTLNLPDWQVSHSQQIDRLDHLTCSLHHGANAYLFLTPVFVDPTKKVAHIRLPSTSAIGSFGPSLHIFGITTIPAKPSGLTVVAVKGTQRWKQSHDGKRSYQIITVRVHNTSPTWVQDANVHITGAFIRTHYFGIIARLAPGHILNIDVAVSTLRKERGRQDILVDVIDSSDNQIALTTLFKGVEVGLEDYEPTEASLQTHAAPAWYQAAKFGIFIHWGVYSVPSWAPVGADYAEWYWWNYNQKNSATYQYHRTFYGPDVEYDDFIQAWHPDQFDPIRWLETIDSSGAKYFVFTTKHHDGIALFDTKVSNRSSVQLNPHRDFVKELFDAAEKHYPHLKRGVYFSLPEWYHPDYRDDSIHWNGPPVNPYTEKTVPYTGGQRVSDFVNDIQVPQFLELIQQFEPDIMWCDIGAINNSTAWQAKFLNSARNQGRDVTFNDRCGNGVSDFATVEYNDVNYVPSRYWESTRGIDPHSFGYNHQTKDQQYASTASLLQELVSTVAKGGNFLLNIGPEGSGHIPHVMKKTLNQMGQWLDTVDESIFQSIPYWITSLDFHEPGQQLYFTQSNNGKAFYIFCLHRPVDERLVIKSPVPLHSKSHISLLNSKTSSLSWRIFGDGKLVIYVPNELLDREKWIWVFKIDHT
ncbi:alpha-L-fucosidase-domain-containing protein [Choanephora cucurbitarum]|nr:alpha-L-fucosidase-domain-containing protein [Choanephora cucurbitarum]